MHRIATLRGLSLLTCSLLVAVAAVAAPAPVYKTPRASGVWSDGWHKPVDPVGDCRFDREGDRLTVTVPSNEGNDCRLARFLRDVEGDFTGHVRVRGECRKVDLGSLSQAGLFLTDGLWSLQAGLVKDWLYIEYRGPDGLGQLLPTMPTRLGSWPLGLQKWSVSGLPAEGALHLRLQRQGDRVRVGWGQDGEAWTQHVASLGRFMPRRLMVGVFVEAQGPVIFQAVFDQFHLTKPLK